MNNFNVWPDIDSVADFAVITMVKNDLFYLDIWIKHYKKYLNPLFVIIDHSSDESVSDWVSINHEDIKCNVVKIPNIAFDDRFKSAALSSLANIYQGCCKLVITSDVDEILIPFKSENNLKDTLLSLNEDFSAPIGVEFVHNRLNEPEYDSNIDCLNQRSTFFFTSGYSKPVIWKKDAFFSPGLHGINKEYSFTDQLALVHLRSIDYNYTMQRQLSRNSAVLSNEQVNNKTGLHWQRDINDKSWFGYFIFEKALSVSSNISFEHEYNIFFEKLAIPKKVNSPFYKHDISITSPLMLWDLNQ